MVRGKVGVGDIVIVIVIVYRVGPHVHHAALASFHPILLEAQ